MTTLRSHGRRGSLPTNVRLPAERGINDRRGALGESRPTPSSLADVLDLVLDKGVVIDAYVRLSAIGIEVLTLDARVVVASVDTYLRFAEAVNRLDLQPRCQVTGLAGLAGEPIEDVAEHKTRAALQPVVSKAQEIVSPGQNRDDEQAGPAPRRRAAGTRTTPTRKRPHGRPDELGGSS